MSHHHHDDSSRPPFDYSSTISYTQPPNPDWEFGQGVSEDSWGKEWIERGKKAGFKVIDPLNTDVRLYPLLTSGIVPRPVGFVATRSKDGVDNLAPFSWFNSVTADPPVISLGLTTSRVDAKKDTTRNILETKEFTVNIISEPFVRQANSCSVNAPFDISEWDISGLTQTPSETIKPPKVAESAFTLECTLFQSVPIIHPEKKVETTTLILGLIKRIHVRNDVLNSSNTIDLDKLQPVTRLGDISYGRVLGSYKIPRPDWNGTEAEKLKAAVEAKGSHVSAL
ncbi:hypothetical protein DL96DRAFT_1589729 [Flagelloscypha sp. PMI_526]|nr:hypothetical protein DL96DRAFT_1589729 [Flagelloscypha sp. PMI_526]